MDVYVFGAGASKPYDAPLMSEFLRDVLIGSAFESDFMDEIVTLAGALDRWYGTSIADGVHNRQIAAECWICLKEKNVDIELCLGRAIEENNAILRDAIEKIIFDRLNTKRLEYSNSSGPYYEFITALLDSGQPACLISFNYDVLLDHALFLEAARRQRAFTYGVDFRCDLSFDDPRYCGGGDTAPSYRRLLSGDPNPKICLLKLHGSLNWRQCADCHELHLDFNGLEIENYSSLWKCYSCGSKMRFTPILVAPRPDKKHPKAFDGMRALARLHLREAEGITVIGYSLPESDRMTIELFSEAPQSSKLTIVNKNGEVADRLAEALNGQFSCRHSTFEEYCERLTR